MTQNQSRPNPPGLPPGYFDAGTLQYDYQFMNNLETLTYFIRVSDAVPTTGGLVVPWCLRRVQGESLSDFLDAHELSAFHLWAVNIPNGNVGFTGNVTAGQPLVTGCAVTASTPGNGILIPGQFVQGPGIPLATWIVQVVNNQIVLSAPPTVSGTAVALNAHVIPKSGDIIQDQFNIRWLTQRADYQTFSTRYRVPVLKYVGGT